MLKDNIAEWTGVWYQHGLISRLTQVRLLPLLLILTLLQGLNLTMFSDIQKKKRHAGFAGEPRIQSPALFDNKAVRSAVLGKDTRPKDTRPAACFLRSSLINNRIGQWFASHVGAVHKA